MKRSPAYIAAMLAVAAGLVAPSLARAQAKPVVAVLYFDNNSIGRDRADYDGLGKGIADLLINDLASNQTLRVVERDRIQSVLEEQKLTRAGDIDAQTAVHLGHILGAQYMITGGFMNVNGTMVLTSRVIDVETSAILDPIKLQTKGQDVLAFVSQLSDKLDHELKLPSPASRVGDATPAPATERAGKEVAAVRPAPAVKLDWKTALLYSKALEAEDRGNRARAVDYYSEVLARFPDFAPAKKNRDRARQAGD